MKLLENIKSTKAAIKSAEEILLSHTMQLYPELNDGQVRELLRLKWIVPFLESLATIPDVITNDLKATIKALTDKYATRLVDIHNDINQASNSLASLIDELTGNAYDMEALNEFKNLLNK